jgi:hypothetical protein
MEILIQNLKFIKLNGLCSEFSFRALPTELMIKILNFWIMEDFRKFYFSCKDLKPILDYLIKKNNLSFIWRLDMIFENIIFKYYADAIISCRNKFNIYDGFIEKMYKNQKLSIKIWKEKCKKYNYRPKHIPNILSVVFEEEQKNYDVGNFKKKKNYYDITIYQSLFMCKLIEDLNH